VTTETNCAVLAIDTLGNKLLNNKDMRSFLFLGLILIGAAIEQKSFSDASMNFIVFILVVAFVMDFAEWVVNITKK